MIPLTPDEVAYLERVLDEADHDQSHPPTVATIESIYQKLFGRPYSCCPGCQVE